jgi:hypothetical protein
MIIYKFHPHHIMVIGWICGMHWNMINAYICTILLEVEKASLMQPNREWEE